MKNQSKNKVIIATINKDHNKMIKESKALKDFKIIIINNELNLKKINFKKIRYIFFIHWRWKVPKNLLNKYECVCFHMTDLPYGRGGSPLQNLIIRGYKETKLSALKMNEKIDSGPIYLKRKLVLNGSASQIYKRVAKNCLQMIKKIISTHIEPKEQIGKITNFKRRKPSESKIDSMLSLRSLYDFIRMLDAPGYPKAFIEHKNIKIDFSNVKFKKNRLDAKVELKLLNK